MADYGQGEYFPSAKVRLIVRLEEYGDVAGESAPRDLKIDPVVPPQLIRGPVDKRSPATYEQTITANNEAGYEVRLKGGQSPPAGAPQQVDSSADARTYVIGAIIPHDVKIGLNGFKEPDTCDIAIRFIDCPLDFRAVRAIAVEVYVGTVSQNDFTAGVQGQTRQVTRGQSVVQEPLHVIPDAWVDASGATRSNLRFQGFVDDVEGPELTDGGVTLVRLKCLDNTRLLIDQAMPPGLTFDTAKGVDEATAQLLANFPQFAGFTVVYRPAVGASDVPKLGKVLADTAVTATGAPAGSGGGGAKTPSIWDFLTELMLDIGHSIRVEGTLIIIQRVRASTSANFPPRIGDPYKGRTWNGTFHALRTFIAGRNVMRAKLGRRFARSSQNIECRSYCTATKQTLMARYPPQGGGKYGATKPASNRLLHILPGDGRTETKYTVVNVPGVTDQATLVDIAQHYYEGLNRAELKVNIMTRDLASYGGDNSDPDLLDMLAGDRIRYLVEKVDSSSPLHNDLGQLEEAMVQVGLGFDQLTALGYDPNFVRAYLFAYSSISLPTTFVVRAIGMQWNFEQGVTLEIDAVNMIEVRADGTGVADQDDKDLNASGTTASTPVKQPGGA